MLEALSQRFPDCNVHIRSFETNRELQRLCALKWHARRALLFMDAYGHQIDWNTIVRVAHTRAIDLWLLFPLGIGVSRMSMTVGEIPAPWRTRLNLLLDTDRWLAGFNRAEAAVDEALEANTDTLIRYFADRLRTVFPIVARPGVLCTSDGKPLYLLCFASGSAGEHGRIVLKMADDLLEEVAP